ncbi:MAG: alkaline phosphatase family protein [Myxococcales bacterium]|nr:alkaline phosphatase family protein [Myxococcales bacterium]
MMRQICRWLGVALVFSACAGRQPDATKGASVPAKQPGLAPKLIVLVVLDQLPQWVLETRAHELEPHGFLRGRAAQSVALRGEFSYAATMTAVGHATIATGVLPKAHGVFANGVYSVAAHKEISVFTGADRLVTTKGVSTELAGGPQPMRVPTVFDELKRAGRLGQVIAISQKNRGAIALGGRLATAAVWQHARGPMWASSTYYGASLPSWAEAPVDGDEPTQVQAVDALFDLAEKALAAHALGRNALPDVLAISVSSLDWAGHAHGAESAEYLDVLRAADRRLEALAAAFTTTYKFAPGDVVLVVTSDHGAAPLPETPLATARPAAWSTGELPSRHDPDAPTATAGRFLEDDVVKTLDAGLDAQRGAGDWLMAAAPPYLYLGREAEALAPAAREALLQQLLTSLRQMPGVWRAYAVGNEGAVLPSTPADALDVLVQNSVAPALSSDIYLLLSPYWIFGSGYEQGTNHGTPWDYDRQVPVIVWPARAISPRAAGKLLPMTDLAAMMRKMIAAKP